MGWLISSETYAAITSYDIRATAGQRLGHGSDRSRQDNATASAAMITERLSGSRPTSTTVTAGLSLGGAVFHGLTAEHTRMFPELITYLIGDEDVQGDSCT
jgi:hypothetical protein